MGKRTDLIGGDWFVALEGEMTSAFLATVIFVEEVLGCAQGMASIWTIWREGLRRLVLDLDGGEEAVTVRALRVCSGYYSCGFTALKLL
jgi:hypothetical protein